jgi:hypothetical protein
MADKGKTVRDLLMGVNNMTMKKMKWSGQQRKLSRKRKALSRKLRAQMELSCESSYDQWLRFTCSCW